MEGEELIDVYEQKFGFRDVTWSKMHFFINGVQTYLTGINKHEDADVSIIIHISCNTIRSRFMKYRFEERAWTMR